MSYELRNSSTPSSDSRNCLLMRDVGQTAAAQRHGYVAGTRNSSTRLLLADQ